MIRVLVVILTILALGSPGVTAQVVLMPPGTAQTFRDRVEWAESAARGQERSEYWFGFSAGRSLRSGTHYGQWGGSDPRLGDLLAEAAGTGSNLRQAIESELERLSARGEPGVHIDTKIAVLLRISAARVVKVEVLSLSSGVRLDGLPLMWTGPATGAEPVNWLTGHYRRDGGSLREDLLSAVAVQQDLTTVGPFLESELRNSPSPDVREAAAWWVSDRLGAAAVPHLTTATDRDPAQGVREAAVHALSRIDSRDARAVILRTARAGSGGAGEAARFVLVRWAEERSTPGPSQPTPGPGETRVDVEVQKAALYALAEDPAALDMMIRTARSHRNPELRRAALYWLADSDELDALEALVEMSGADR